MKSAFIVVHYGSYFNTLRLVRNIKKFHRKNKIIIINNDASKISTRNLKKNFQKELLVNNKKNLGYSGGLNKGIQLLKKHKFDYAICLNNDLILKSKINFKTINEELKLNKKIAIIGFKTNQHSNNYIKKNTFTHKVFARELNINNEVYNFHGSAFLIRVNLPRSINFFYEDLFLYCEEFYQSFKLLKKGYQIKNLNLGKLLHKSKFKKYSVYYQVRNFILIFYKENFSFYSWSLLFFWIFKWLLNNITLIKFIFSGIYDGLKKKVGKKIF